MKAEIKFDLSDPDDIMAHHRCIKSTDMALAIFQIRHNFRDKCHNRIEASNFDKYEAMEFVIDELFDILNDNNVNHDFVL